MTHTWETYLADQDDALLASLTEFLRIPSISALPERATDVERAATWVADRLRQIGLPEVALLLTARHPVVFGRWHVADDRPTAMIYGHYDVQPPDPLDLWQSPPFAPEIRDGRIFARGATDDKGNLFAPLAAVEALVRTQGAPPINLLFFVEGEEEIGSPSLPAFVHAERDRLACDFVVAADGSMFGPDTPSLTVSSKGLAACQIDVQTGRSDLHSGQYGAAAPNAVQALVQLTATFHTPDSRVAVAGFYDAVGELSPEERAEIAAVPFDPEAFRESLEAPALWGEPGYSVLERRWVRPTLDLNGFWGGFQGAGVKTVTPCAAHTKITCRLVPDQDPEDILSLIERHVGMHCPQSAHATVTRFPGSSRPFSIRRDHPALACAGTALRELYGKDPLVVRAGGTLPVAAVFQRELGVDTVFFAWGMPGNQIHAPNEWMRLEDLRRAMRGYCLYLSALAR
jgi:acetylornithine deacetylase/succinyl-diaminopimelate desuccinylase-like protein